MAVIPNGVDTGHSSARSPAKPSSTCCSPGNMNYPPNIDSVLFLVQKVLPLVRRERPHTSLLISGVDPSAERA